MARIRKSARTFDERAKRDTKDPAGVKNWYRSLRPEIGVFNAMCANGDCIVRREIAEDDVLLCPCCGSRYDLAGRVFSGPAPSNLTVPPHEYVDDGTIAFPALVSIARVTPSRADPRSRSPT